MPDDTFKPKLGRIRDAARSKTLRHTAATLEQVGKAGGRMLRPARNALRLGPQRGLATGAMAASGLIAPGTRRAIVKARYTKLTHGAAHVRYILRDGITRDGAQGRLYDANGDDVDGRLFLDRSADDPHQFRFIISAEDSDRLADLKPMIRDLMRQVQVDLGVNLDWMAVDHFNTGHPHTHIVLRGRDAEGQDLILARQYIAHGIWARVQDLVTLELGPETQIERMRKLVNEVGQERMTRIDRTIIGQVKDNVLALTAGPEADPTRHALRQGRLKTLERLGLADERHPGVWVLDGALESKLKQLGARADTFKTMQRVLAAAGIERGVHARAVFEKGDRKTPLVGRVIGVGLVDEITDRQYIVVDGVDGRAHYAELGRRAADTAPGKGMIVKLSADRLDGRPQSATRVEVVSPLELRDQHHYAGPTWFDEVLAGKERVVSMPAGFGAEVERGLAERAQWLLSQKLADTVGADAIQLRPEAMAQLRQREIDQIGRDLSARHGLPFAPPRPGATIAGTYAHTLTTPTAKLAVIKTGHSVTVVPWRPAMEQQRGQPIQVIMHPSRVVWRGQTPG